jgi:predicted nucleotidyltransferase
MKEQEMALKNTVLRTVTGSHLYGTSTPESDHDEAGIFVPNQAYVIGTKTCEQVEIKSNPSDSGKRNGPEDTDLVLYSLPKFIHLASGCNPNIIELLFSNSYSYLSPLVGEELVKNRSLFLSQLVRKTFVGYAKAQMAKLTTKKSRLTAIRSAKARIEGYRGSYTKHLLDKLYVRDNEQIYKTYEAGLTIAHVWNDLISLEQEYGLRTKSVEQYGYDTKFAMHIIRLLYEAIDLLENGTLIFPFTGDSLKHLMDVRAGKWGLEGVLECANDLILMVDTKETKLPENCNLDRICELQVKLLTDYWRIN